MITVRNRNHKPSSFLFDPFFYSGRPVNTSVQQTAKKSKISTNIIRTENGFDIELAAPGFNKESFKINIENHKLTVDFVKPEPSSKQEFTRKEFNVNSTSRSFALPKDIDTEKISAHYDLGVLTISLVKAPKVTKTIDIK